MSKEQSLVLFFIINPKSGSQNQDYTALILDHFKDTGYKAHIYKLEKNCTLASIKEEIHRCKPHRVAAVGGDGTVKLVAECLLHTGIPLAIIPTGSANGMAKEINLKTNLDIALNLMVKGEVKEIHALSINNELSIHLADIGINARIVKKFQSLKERGMLGYARATWRALKRHKKMHVSITINGQTKYRKAEMVVLANGTTYGTGVKINRTGSLFDDQFEIVIVKWFSIIELFKMWFNFKAPPNPFKTEIIHTKEVVLHMKENTFFQVDGEYIGKVNQIEAKIIPKALLLIT
ncbi:diacylglycerol/lipid kinase family protein [Olivibacter domesticus]|uniref:Diacylglycerol kinase family enzyme n=1 Tax=Olivibacter domesticus TaxID=407022 RepID=A0A1H7Z5X5_OLID1|nr:diacylglycerol kinase family protein [Olivibacter domesticus]SEM52948.1 Diacylglycerol kinase family enzyme [Olivibacter domesticus]